MLPIILGSSSPFRRELLSKLGLAFDCDSPHIDESPLADETPEQLVRRLAEAKARAVASKHPTALIIASDQVAVLDGKILGKPGDHATATHQLSAASGQVVTFLTSLALFNAVEQRLQIEVIPFKVYFRELNMEEIERYLAKEQPYNCAGSFKSEGLGISLFDKLEGDDPNTLIGLPLIRLISMFRNEDINIP